jgi:hypothetical protein
MAELVSVADLLSAPERFDGRLIIVAGFYVGEREHHALYSSREQIGTSQLAVWIRHEETVHGQARAEQLNRSWIRVVGTFHNRRRSGCGHFNAYSAYITGIREFASATS